MSRSATLMIILAFVLGLWIGLNPQARAQAEKAAADVGVQAKVVIDHIFGRISEESPPASQPPVKPERSNFLGQLSAAIQKIWLALKQLWLDLVHDTRRETQKTHLAAPHAALA